MCGHGDTGACFSVSRCFLKLGEWQLNLQGINESTIPKVLQYYSAATEHDRGWYKVTEAQAAAQPHLLRGQSPAPGVPSACALRQSLVVPVRIWAFARWTARGPLRA